VRVFLTGGTGFIGGEIARLLRERGDEVVGLVRTPAKAAALTALRCELASGDLSDEGALRTAMKGADAVIHCAAVYEIGVTPARREALVDANVRGTERVLGAALANGICKAVYVSNLREVVSSSDGVTFWASSDKAQRELGWSFRPLAEGLATVTSS
jgi:nucleoside-diphosphate-sugar epimerase